MQEDAEGGGRGLRGWMLGQVNSAGAPLSVEGGLVGSSSRPLPVETVQV